MNLKVFIGVVLLVVSAGAQTRPITKAVTVNPTNYVMLFPAASQFATTNGFVRVITSGGALTVTRIGDAVHLRVPDLDPSGYLTTAAAAATYQPLGDYALAASLADYLTAADAASTYQPIGNYALATSLLDYLTVVDAALTYQPIGTYLQPADLVGYARETNVVLRGGDASSFTNIGSASIRDDSIGTEDIGVGAVGTDELVGRAVTTAKIATNAFALDLAESGTAIQVRGLMSKRLPSLSGHGGDVLGLDVDGEWAFVTAGVGDMLASDYDTNLLAGFYVDWAVMAKYTTNALGFMGYPASTTGREDEAVVTYDADTETYLHRSLSDLGGGDMLKSVYDTDNNAYADVADLARTSTVARTSTNATGFLGYPASTTGREDEAVVAYDANTETYLHRSLADLGGGDMLKSVYDANADDVIDLANRATVASGLVANTVSSSNIVNGSISNVDISATAAIDPSKISGTALTQSTGFGGDIDGTYANLTVTKIRNVTVLVPAAGDDGMALVYDSDAGAFVYGSTGVSYPYFNSTNGTGVVVRAGEAVGYFLRDDGTFAEVATAVPEFSVANGTGTVARTNAVLGYFLRDDGQFVALTTAAFSELLAGNNAFVGSNSFYIVGFTGNVSMISLDMQAGDIDDVGALGVATIEKASSSALNEINVTAQMVMETNLVVNRDIVMDSPYGASIIFGTNRLQLSGVAYVTEDMFDAY